MQTTDSDTSTTPQPKPEPPIPVAQVNKSRALSIIWLVPIVTLIVALVLLVGYLRNNGTEVTLHMPSADGVEINKTPIKILNVEVGKVIDVRLNDAGNGVLLTAKINGNMQHQLRSDSMFWIVKPEFDQRGIRGLGTLVSGAYIGFKPGNATEIKDEFIISNDPPSDDLGEGLHLKLSSERAKMLPNGAPVFYEDLQVGQIIQSKFDVKNQHVNYDIFIQKSHQDLVGEHVKFWIKSGVNIQTNSQGIQIDTAPIGSILSGAIAFTQPLSTGKGAEVKDGHTFTLHDNISDVMEPATPRAFYLVAFFDQSMRGLSAGATVEYKGLPIGVVEKTPFFHHNDQLNLLENRYIPVQLRIEPAAIEMGASPIDSKQWQQKFDHAIRQGLYATIISNNIVTGNMSIELTDELSADPSLKPQDRYAGLSVIPTRAVGLNATVKNLNRLLVKFNDLPLEQTVGQLNQNLAELQKTLGSVNKLLNSSETQSIPKELNQTLRQLRGTLEGISPDSPAYRDIQNTLQSLDRTLQKTDPLLKKLGEKPNALIFDSKSADPVPKGQP